MQLRMFNLMAMIVVCFFNTLNVISQDEPLLFYYSAAENAFVIETAGGVQIGVLAAYDIPSDIILSDDGTGNFVGPGWSNSNEWFAWTMLSRNGLPTNQAFITDLNSVTPIDVSEGLIVDTLRWSPSQDILLIQTRTDYSEFAETEIRLFNPASLQFELILNSEDIFGENYTNIRTIWSPDGGTIAAISRDQIGIIDTENWNIDVIPAFTQNVVNQHDLFSQNTELPIYLNDNMLVYISGEDGRLSVLDTTMLTSTSFETLPNTVVARIDVNETGELGLVFLQNQESLNYELWTVSFNTLEAHLSHPSVHYSLNSGPPFDSTFWHFPNQAFFVSSEFEIFIINFDENGEQSVSQSLDLQDDLVPYAPIRWTDDENLIFMIEDQNTNGVQINQYSLENSITRTVFPLDQSVYFSAGYFSEIYNSRLFFQDSMFDLSTGDSTRLFEFIGPTSFQFNLDDVSMDASENWVIAHEDFGSVYVNNINGTNLRILAEHCVRASRSCYGWMPILGE